MEKELDLILDEYEEGNMNLLTLKDKLLLLFSVSNNALIKACDTVVKGYEGDGMECMRIRDEVFYNVCKDAIQKHCC